MAIKTNTQAAPTSWDDGLDWDNIEPGNVRYLQALQLALAERFAVYNGIRSITYLRQAWGTSPASTCLCTSSTSYDNRTVPTRIEVALRDLVSRFVMPVEYYDYAESLSDFPKAWTFGELLAATGRTLGDRSSRGVPFYETAHYMRTLKEMISLLYLSQVSTYSTGAQNTGTGGADSDEGFPTLTEAMSAAQADMASKEMTWRSYSRVSSAPVDFRCFAVMYRNGGIFVGEKEKRLNYYCTLWDTCRKYGAFFGGESLKPAIMLVCSMRKPPLDYASTDEGVFVERIYDPVDTGLPEGISTLSFPYGTKEIIVHGVNQTIPTPPEPEALEWQYESDGTPYIDYSYSMKGFIGTVAPCLDYRGCFKFN